MICSKSFSNKLFIRFLLAIFIVVLIASCTNDRLAKEMEQFMGRQITVPTDLNAVWNGRDTVLADFTKVPIKLVIWYDSLLCNSCQISKMSVWNAKVAYADSLAQWFSIIYLFTPKKEEANKINIALKADKFDYPIFIDQNGTFVKQNPNLPKSRELHSFLLDKNNRVKLVGSPLYKPALWKLYKHTIQAMIDNDGVLP